MVYDKVCTFGLTKTKGLDTIISALMEEDSRGVAQNLCNDLEPIVLKDFPVLNQVFFELKNAGAQGVLVSGSGSSVFSIFEKDSIEKAVNRLNKIFPSDKKWRVFICHTY